MNNRSFCAAAALLLASAYGFAQEKTAAAKPAPTAQRAADGHPNLSGTWAFAIDLPPAAIKKTGGGTAAIKTLEQINDRRTAKGAVPGALPSMVGGAAKVACSGSVWLAKLKSVASEGGANGGTSTTGGGELAVSIDDGIT